MLNTDILRSIIKEIYGVDDKYIVPIATNWFLPTVDKDDKVGTWIGYRILNKEPYARAWQSGLFMVKPLKMKFRLSFTGPQAEELANQTLLWEDRYDVTVAFERHQIQVNYTTRQLFSYPVRNSGFNDEMCWVVDFDAQTTYEVDTKQKPWFSPRT